MPGAQFIDCYGISVGSAEMSARQAAERMMGQAPAWISRLMVVRNFVVTPFRLRRPAWGRAERGDAIGMFPVLSDTKRHIVLGFDDRHLDFRVVVSVIPEGAGGLVSLTTVVRKHNLLGTVYLAAILPFHVAIVRNMVARAAHS